MKFSIGIAAYKANYLQECIESVLSQDYKDFELIIVDDASPDNILSIVNKFDDNRISFYRNEKNFGAVNVIDNWNKCLSFAKGDYFVLLGDDDKIDTDFLKEFSILIQKHPELYVYHCRSKLINEKGDVVKLTEPRAEFESVYDLMNQRIKDYRLQYISDFVYCTKWLKPRGFYKLPLAWCSDDITSYIAAYEGGGIANINRPVFNYRKNPFTITSSGATEFKLKAIDGWYEWCNGFLRIESRNFEESILRNEIIDNLKTNYDKKKFVVLAESFHKKGNIRLVIKYIKAMNKFNLSIKLILKSYFFYMFFLKKVIRKS